MTPVRAVDLPHARTDEPTPREAALAAVGKDYFSFQPANAAVLVIDMQNSFLDADGAFRIDSAPAIVDRVNGLLAEARAHGIPTIWVQTDHGPPAGGLMLERYPIIRETRELWKGTKSFELYPELAQPSTRDPRILKHKYDAFHDTDLDTVLRNLGKDTIIITGVTTECCCESTARSGCEHDYKVVFVSDATATSLAEDHRLACDRIGLLFARVMTTAEVRTLICEGGEASP